MYSLPIGPGSAKEVTSNPIDPEIARALRTRRERNVAGIIQNDEGVLLRICIIQLIRYVTIVSVELLSETFKLSNLFIVIHTYTPSKTLSHTRVVHFTSVLFYSVLSWGMVAWLVTTSQAVCKLYQIFNSSPSL